MLRTPAVALATLALVALTGCGSDDGSNEAPEISADKATGVKIAGTGYAYNVPEGWDVTPETPGFDPDSTAADLTDDDGFTDNVNVILNSTGEVTPEQVEDEGAKELETVGASGVTVEDRVTIAGNESAHLSANMSIGTNEYSVDQFYVTGDGNTYVVTFSFSTDVSTEDRAAVSDAILASWTWTD